MTDLFKLRATEEAFRLLAPGSKASREERFNARLYLAGFPAGVMGVRGTHGWVEIHVVGIPIQPDPLNLTN
jgi:hypothetical protein